MNNSQAYIDLHRHFEGSIPLTTLFEISQTHSIPTVSVAAIEELRPLVQVTDSDPRTMQSFLGKFPVLRGFYQSEAIIRRITREIVKDAADDGIKYLELRFSPQALSAVKNFSLEDVTSWVYDEVQLAAKECTISVNLIIALVRHGDIKRIEKVADIAIERSGEQIVGIDIAGNEVDFPSTLFVDIFNKAKKAGLGITIHAGEWRNAESVIEAIELLHADRIGHGIAIAHDVNALNRVKERNITLEICPTSNLQTGAIDSINEHPVLDLLRSDVKVTLNTDDPAISGITLSSEIEILRNQLGATSNDLQSMTENALEAAFVSDSKRELLRSQIQR